MPCFSPLRAWQRDNGEVVFVERGAIYRELSLPCGQCLWCRLQRARTWAMRCMHEASLHKENSFITLTYAAAPEEGLRYRDFQLFLKRLRKSRGNKSLRFFMCGEYGGDFGRPHYHALIFGERFNDRVFWRTSESGAKCFRSDSLERCWTLGNSEVGDCTFESAAYVARYCVGKVTGHAAKEHYGFDQSTGKFLRTPEFARMSLGGRDAKGGIGRDWYRLYSGDVYPHDFVIVDGKELKPPKYYDKLFKADSPDEFEQMQMEREARGRSFMADNTPRRLKDKEEVARARQAFYKRSLHA